MKYLLKSSFLFFVVFYSYADDIEIYVGGKNTTKPKPQVLLIFDNSGSMKDEVEIKDAFDPNYQYGAPVTNEYIYFQKGTNGGIPLVDDQSELRRFDEVLNSCETARQKLKTVGYYTGYVRTYTYVGESGSWTPLSENNWQNNGRSKARIIDCLDDITLNNPKNASVRVEGSNTVVPLQNGYPIDGLGNTVNQIYYTNDVSKTNTHLGYGESVTLYSHNYLRWYYSAATVRKTKLAIAKETTISLIESAPGVEFGLQIFNLNGENEFERDGGRIVAGIQEMTPTSKSNLINTINGLTASTWTPLCETLYEASRYFSGGTITYGNKDSDYYNPIYPLNYLGNYPPRDTSIEKNANLYEAPYRNCSNRVHIIIVTDGEPSTDNAADSLIANISGIGAVYEGSYLPALAEWMNKSDINPTMAGEQTASTYTIGFGDEAVNKAGKLLAETARLGGGKYYEARHANSLLTSLQDAISSILKTNSSFTAPTITSNTFDRTRTLNSVYYTLFRPANGPRWQGNLKKLKIKDNLIVDRNNNDALSAKGGIKDSARTFWSSGNADGNSVEKGGITELFSKNPNRKLYSDLENASALSLLTKANPIQAADKAAFSAHMDVNESDLVNYLHWAMGYDVDDEDADNNIDELRADAFADPLHFKPLVINYGDAGNKADPRIFIGTNGGALHMFQDNDNTGTVSENWAFLPYNLLRNVKRLRHNATNTEKVYGVDGIATSYTKDVNGDGLIGSGDKAWIFFGLRRGGTSYYALDVSQKNSPPILKWRIDAKNDPQKGDFSKLGQTWSPAKVSHLRHPSTGVVIPVLIFGGGYSVNKDSGGVGTDDVIGNAIYIVNADNGKLLWSATDSATSSTNLSVPLTDSFPGGIATLDSDFDGVVDRLYAADTGGNIWRVDMPNKNPFDNKNPWRAYKIAELGDNKKNKDDLRFFSEPSIARSYTTITKEVTVFNNGVSKKVVSRQEKPFDAILLGSGDRASPLNTDTANSLFMIRDENIISEGISTPPSPINLTDLYDLTNDPYDGATAKVKEKLDIEISKKKGWYISLQKSGEKSLATPIVVAGVAYFTSYSPNTSSNNNGQSCTLKPGGGALYAVDLHLGTSVYNWRRKDLGESIPDAPSIALPPAKNGEEDKLLLITEAGVTVMCPAGDTCNVSPKPPCGVGQICNKSSMVGLKTFRTNTYVTENVN